MGTLFFEGDKDFPPQIGEPQKVLISPDILSNLSNFFTYLCALIRENVNLDSLLCVVVLLFSAYFANFVIY